MSNDAEVRAAMERWPGYDEQSWSERFAELDRRHADLSSKLFTFAAEARSHDGEWEAIETAPKDGSWFLTYTPGESSYGPCDFAMYDVEFGDFCKDRCGFQYVTHWMRLPAPPMSAVPLFDEGRL